MAKSNTHPFPYDPSPTLLTKEDFSFFRNWSQINLDSITWQGKYRDEFEEFWNIFFVEGLSLHQVTQRFDYATTESGIGSLHSWFDWLQEKFLCYVFIFKGLSIFQISQETGIPPGKLANIFRILLIENFPHLQNGFNEKFGISDVISKNLSITYRQIAKEFSIKEDVFSSVQDDVMISLEITLYKEWKIFLTKLKKNFIHAHFNLVKIRRFSSFKWQFKIFRDLVFLSSTCIGLIYGIRYVNHKYETSLVNKISVYEPQFKWSDKNLNFRRIASDNSEQLRVGVKDIEEVDDALGEVDSYQEERFDVESEVSLTSWDALPKNFNIADREQSEYEESGSGYRESRYGNTKVYRVLMKSEDVLKAKSHLDTLLKKYNVTQVDNVKPGMRVPGGIYYNLYVPIPHLKEFMAQALEGKDSVLYESRTRTKRNPPGKSKVFIWVKSI